MGRAEIWISPNKEGSREASVPYSATCAKTAFLQRAQAGVTIYSKVKRNRQKSSPGDSRYWKFYNAWNKGPVYVSTPASAPTSTVTEWISFHSPLSLPAVTPWRRRNTETSPLDSYPELVSFLPSCRFCTCYFSLRLALLSSPVILMVIWTWER